MCLKNAFSSAVLFAVLYPSLSCFLSYSLSVNQKSGASENGEHERNYISNGTLFCTLAVNHPASGVKDFSHCNLKVICLPNCSTYTYASDVIFVLLLNHETGKMWKY